MKTVGKITLRIINSFILYFFTNLLHLFSHHLFLRQLIFFPGGSVNCRRASATLNSFCRLLHRSAVDRQHVEAELPPSCHFKTAVRDSSLGSGYTQTQSISSHDTPKYGAGEPYICGRVVVCFTTYQVALLIIQLQFVEKVNKSAKFYDEIWVTLTLFF